MRNPLILKAMAVTLCFFVAGSVAYADSIFNSPEPTAQAGSNFYGKSQPLYSAEQYNQQMKQASQKEIQQTFGPVNEKAQKLHAELTQGFQAEEAQKQQQQNEQSQMNLLSKPGASISLQPKKIMHQKPEVPHPMYQKPAAPTMYQTPNQKNKNTGSVTNFGGDTSSDNTSSGGLGIQY